MSEDFERSIVLAPLRQKVIQLSHDMVNEYIQKPSSGTVPLKQDDFDAAVIELAAELNKPLTCYACGQEKCK